MPSFTRSLPIIRTGALSRTRLYAATAALLLAIALGTAFVVTSNYHDTLRQEQTNLRNLAIAFSAQTMSAMRSLDQLLDEERNDYLARPRSQAGAPSRTGLPAVHRHVLGLALFDNNGRQLSGQPMAAPAGANAPALPDDDSVAVDIGDIDPLTGRGVLRFARPLLDAGGGRIGFMVGRIDTAYFIQLYTEVMLGMGGSVTLMHQDGAMLVRGPVLPQATGRSFAATPLFQTQLPAADNGAFEADSPTHDARRIYGYSRVPAYPLVIITGMDKADALTFWYERLATAAALLGLTMLSLSALAWRVGRDSARQASLIAELASSQARLAKSADYLAGILGAIGNPVYVVDRNRRFVLVNDAYCRFAGKRREELIGRHETDALDAAEAAARTRTCAQVLQGAGEMVSEIEVANAAGELRTLISLTSRLISENNEAQIVCVYTDITERKRAEVRLAYLADFDLLTALPNQARFRRTLAAEVDAAAGAGEALGVMVLSLERLQELIDLMGHAAGEPVLRKVAAMLRELAPGGAPARIMSNQFALLIKGQVDRQALERFAAGLHAALSGAFPVSQRDFYLGPAIGIAFFPDDGACGEELFRRADIARHRAGAEGHHPIQFFSESSHLVLDERLTMESELRQALPREELRLVYQPKVDIGSGLITGFEALLRWTSPVLGVVAPVRFIPIAESTGLIAPIGAWVVARVCEQIRDWQDTLGSQVKVAVNLSPRQFHQPDLIPMLRRCLAASGIAAHSLELEITESTVMSKAEHVDVLLREIRALGMSLTIDDFGTGYSSLAYLKRFPVQCLKIDRAFIRDIGHDEDSLAIVRTIISLCHGLKMTVVAEGVETAGQLELLRDMNCHAYQGFLFSRPVEAGEVCALIEANLAAVSACADSR
ncbi:MAG: EAL domain-containing protein [Noviherbaspirillum sp.]